MNTQDIDAVDWSSLSCRNGDASFVAIELKKLFENPEDEERFNLLWPCLCSEGTTHSSAFASAPFLLELSKLTTAHSRFKYLYVLSLFRMCEPLDANHPRHCPSKYRERYHHSLQLALPLVAELSAADLGNENFYVLSALATLKGMSKLASCIETIALEDFKCPECQVALA